ncbi:hypothetical protein G6N76_08780 [Rhizobium daejeonense]|uniref:Uncharacterized protein n=1 Tax=Rhizobium daejeonense TaxID=240521 RepID=A0A6M1S3L7_9HYPH|nr:hypothetical protein [Rhizobium daejeonense]NGO63770.1 hypothetical protein [Rhizobium daejeonense]
MRPVGKGENDRKNGYVVDQFCGKPEEKAAQAAAVEEKGICDGANETGCGRTRYRRKSEIQHRRRMSQLPDIPGQARADQITGSDAGHIGTVQDQCLAEGSSCQQVGGKICSKSRNPADRCRHLFKP